MVSSEYFSRAMFNIMETLVKCKNLTSVFLILTKTKKMKAISVEQIHYMARNMKCDDFVQKIKVLLTGQPETIEIDCNPIIIDANLLNELNKKLKEHDRKTTS